MEAWLSSSRFATYLAAGCGVRPLALDLYEWNCQVGGAILRDLAHLEIGLRNAYDAAVSDRWSGACHWLVDPDSPLRAPIHRTKRVQGRKQRVDINRKSRDLLDAATTKAGPAASVGKLIAELSFGFWRYCTSAGHEKTLWVPYLHRAFPTGTDRRQVDEPLGRLNGLRNRVAHHEPLLRERLDQRHAEILELCRLLSPELAQHLTATTTVSSVLARRPV